MCRRLPNTRYLLDEADGIHSRAASSIAQERRVQQGLGRRLSLPNLIFLLFIFFNSPAKSTDSGFFSVTKMTDWSVFLTMEAESYLLSKKLLLCLNPSSPLFTCE
jgi:hypothetical protein